MTSMNVISVISMPRISFTSTWRCINEAGLRPITGSSAYWHADMDMILRMAAKSEAEAILTLDYDSLFTKAQLQQLFNDLCTSGYDALFPVMAKRMCKQILARPTEIKKEGMWPAEMGHFGLTFLKTEALRRMKKPWFFGKPDQNGHWDVPGRTDPDVWFWRQWLDSGNTLALDPHVSIGHLEERVAVVDTNGDVHYLSLNEWETVGRATALQLKDEANTAAIPDEGREQGV